MIDQEFSENLLKLREQKGLTVEAAALQCGLSPLSFSHYEEGSRAPGLSAIRMICEGLGCSATQLLGY